jgi:hypothetical protein
MVNDATCEITGASDMISWPPTSYIVTATNTGGSASATVTIGVRAIKPVELSFTGGTHETLTVTANGTSQDARIDAASDPIVVYTVTPELPPGLYLNETTSQISGIPTAVTASKLYQFTASNTGGSTTFTQNITVNAVAPANLTYDVAFITFTLGSPVTETPSLNHASMVDGAQLVFSVNRPLPPGVDLETKTGKITGTPSALSVTPKEYIITATNSGGSTTVTLTIRTIAVCPVVQYDALDFYSTHLTTSMAATATNTAGPNAALTNCTVVRPALPAGLSIIPTSCEIVGVATVQTENIKYQVMA